MEIKKQEYDSSFDSSYIEIGKYLYESLLNIIADNRTIIFLCIGTDRCTGDSLGPLVGYRLKHISSLFKKKNIFFYGSLESPVHSMNLENIINKINSNFINPYIVAIDSCLGKTIDIGKIFISNSPLFPGSAINKNLPSVGDLSITGIVNISGKYDFLTLQNTRLYTVFTISDTIFKGINHFLELYTKNHMITAMKKELLQDEQ
ncbi:spore protease YyaC [Clostridium tertium]|uniref:Sporulation protein YyaC n=1 Tax=Clostridium tertium TaxID=1559 RepID=A0A6N3GNW9_9CLOT